MRGLEFITGNVIFKLCYNQIYQLKTTMKLKHAQQKLELHQRGQQYNNPHRSKV